MLAYEPGHFENDFRTPLGQRVWAFLNRNESTVRMETATYLERPAIEALAPDLVAEFGEAIKADRPKQMTGSMVRQILEARGYQLDRQHVPIPSHRRVLFSSGSRYVKVNGERHER